MVSAAGTEGGWQHSSLPQSDSIPHSTESADPTFNRHTHFKYINSLVYIFKVSRETKTNRVELL